MSTPPQRPLKSTAPYAPNPSAADAPSLPAQGPTLPQVRPSPAAGAPPLQVPGYEIQGELGRGGMGVVYLAKNVLMNRLEVLKVANRARLDGQPGAAERFLREIRAAANLSHENIVKAYSALQVGELLVFAMEYVEGEDLDKLVQRQGPLPVAHACHYVSQAALGLQHAHEQGMIHRDIKPANLILTRRGKKHVVKVLDFGLAKAVREGEAATDLTGAGAVMGTPAYMAPEQAQDAANADIRADIYSLGCTLYFLLTGAPPFDGKNIYAILKAHESTEAAPLHQRRAEATPGLAAVVAKMMAKDPARRFQKPIDVAQALAPFIKPSSLPKGAEVGAPGAATADGQPEKKNEDDQNPAAPLPAWLDGALEQAEWKKGSGQHPTAAPAAWPVKINAPTPAAQIGKADVQELSDPSPTAPSIFNRATLIGQGAGAEAPMTKRIAGQPSPVAAKRPNRWAIAAAIGLPMLLLAGAIALWAGGAFRVQTPGAGTSEGPGNGSGTGPGTGQAPAPKTVSEAQRNRWKNISITTGPRGDLLSRLQMTDTILAVPAQPFNPNDLDNARFTIIDLSKPGSQTEGNKSDLDALHRGIWWYIASQNDIKDLINPLGLKGRPPLIIAFMSPELQEELARKEKARTGLSEAEMEKRIEATSFMLTVETKWKWDVQVTDVKYFK